MGAHTPILRRMVLVVLMLVTVSAALPLEGSAQKKGNADIVQACAGGGHASRVRSEDGSRFSNAGECISYVATGGMLDWDDDGDGAPDGTDNCVGFSNAGQADTDSDGLGDLCDATPNGDNDGDGVDNAADLTPNGDSDGDGIDNAVDVCAAGDDGVDADTDGTPDACDSTPNGDSDGDEIDNVIDNCVDIVNAGQEDADNDGIGDPCDTTPNGDDDGDGVDNSADICAVGDDRLDIDGDLVPDACDSTPTGDTDGDGVDNAVDVCSLGNDMVDTDGDGTADACDSTPNGADNLAFTYDLTSPHDQYNDGVIVCGVAVTVTDVYSPYTIYLTYSTGETVTFPVAAQVDGDFSFTFAGGSALPIGESVTEARASGGGVHLQDYSDKTCGVDVGVDPTPNGDDDGDGVDDLSDNCRTTYNPGQEDTDGDGIGNVCDRTSDGAVPTLTYQVTQPNYSREYCDVYVRVTNVYEPFTINLTYSNGQTVNYPVNTASQLDGDFAIFFGGGSALPFDESVTEGRLSGPGGDGLRDSSEQTCGG
jgi:hypothetical protein